MTELLPSTWKVLRMRSFTPEAETQILKQFGTEPMIVVAIDWVKDGTPVNYTDRNISGQPVEGRILDISILDNVFNLDGNTDSKQISMTLDDSDGVLKDIINNNDIHGRPVSISYWDASTPIADIGLLFNGVINSPIIWDEGDRTLKLTVLSKLEDAEYGFSLDESLRIANQPLNLQGKAWPLCFGTVVNVPALQLTNIVEGKLSSSIGIRDFTLVPKYNYLVNCSKCFTCRSGSEFNLDTLISTAAFRPCPNCNRRVCVAIRKLELQIIAQNKLQFTTLTITGSGRFPQGTIITLDIEGAKFTGFFSGTDTDPSSKFVITLREHSQFSKIGSTSPTSVVNSINDEIDTHINTKCGPTVADKVSLSGICDGVPLDTDGIPQKQADAVSDFWRVFNAWPSAGLQFIQPGARVTLSNSANVSYIANLVDDGTDDNGSTFTQILSVKARKRIGQATRLVEVPSSFYSIRNAAFIGINPTEILFPKLLSEINDEWDDDIFVTMKSALSSEITKVLEYLITTYTNFTINTDSFASVRIDLTGWEANFALLKRGNILTLLTDIAFQARCALYIKNNEIFIQFLAKRPTPSDLILESDVENNSLSLGHTDTENLVTKFVAKWRMDYAENEQVQTILRFNVVRYGLKEKEFDFFIYSDEQMVKTASLFWLIRKSQIWRRLRFKTNVHKLQLETFDNIEIRFNDFSPNDILAHIQEASYNSSDYSISFDCWTPVRSGEQKEYDFAFPEDVDINTIFPLLEDIESGAFDITTPGALVAASISSDPDKQTTPLSSNKSCNSDVFIIGEGFVKQTLQTCIQLRYNADPTDPDTSPDTPVPDEQTCAVTDDLSFSQSSTSEDTQGTSDVVDSTGNVIGQKIISTSTATLADQTATKETFTTPTGEDCPDEPNDEESSEESELGDPGDPGAFEDPVNAPADDGCNPPVCPTPSTCDLEPNISEGDCSASVKIFKQFFGLKLFGQLIVTETNVDQYCFNSNEAARLFFNKMIIVMDAQSKPSLGDTQIKLNNLSIVFSNIAPCKDSTANPREDAALISFRQFGPIGLLNSRLPACDKDPGTGLTDAPITDPCVEPDYL